MDYSSQLGIISICKAASSSKGSRWFFVFGFEKHERANISKKELEALQAIAFDLMRLNANQLNVHIESKALQEISYGD